MEIWKDVIGYENYLRISNKGRVYRKERVITVSHYTRIQPAKIAPLQSDKNGYKLVGISIDNKSHTLKVHRLVAEAFCEGKSTVNNEVNHKDGDKTNNFAKNLEWTNRKENIGHAFDNGLTRYKKREMRFCSLCKKEFLRGEKSQSYCSVKCAAKGSAKKKVKERPSKEEPHNLIISTPFTRIGEKYGVSDNAIRRWCKDYCLPFKKEDIKKQN